MSLWDSHRCPVTSHDSERLQLCQTPTFLPAHHTQHLRFQHPRGPSPPYAPGREQVLPPFCRPYEAINTASLPAFPTSACMLSPFSPTCAWERLPTHLLQTTFSTVVLEGVGSPAACFIPAGDSPCWIPWCSPPPWCLVAGAAAWLPALGDVHPWEGAVFRSFAAQQDPAAPQGLCLHEERLVKNGPISSCTPDTRCGPGVQDTKGSKAFYYYSCHQETSTPEEKQACAC